jgi:hypothetical protein
MMTTSGGDAGMMLEAPTKKPPRMPARFAAPRPKRLHVFQRRPVDQLLVKSSL